ncbi:MAG: rod shape-determining protein [Victivallis sp.]
MIVDIGGGTTEVAVISLSGIVGAEKASASAATSSTPRSRSTSGKFTIS